MTQSPAAAGGSPSPIALNDPKVEQLKAMFPEIDADVLASMLAFSNGNIEEACAAILDVAPAPTVEDSDAAMARAVQQELDAEVARAVQNDLDEAAKAERAAALAKDPTVRAAKAVSAGASSTLSMLKKASARTLTAVGARKAAPSSTHGVRLLDASAEPDGGSFNFSPLQVPDYVPSALAVPEPPAAQAPTPLVRQPATAPHAQPAQPAPAPPAAAQPTRDSLLDLSDAAEWGSASPLVAPPPQVTPGATPIGSSDASAGERYTSRLERARRSNAALNRSASVSSTSPPAEAEAKPHVPVGELI